MQKPMRSLLYVPGVNARALAKARTLSADGIVIDLEDAVAPDRKAEARETVAAALAAGGYGDRLMLLRVNGAETPWGEEDAAFARTLPIDGVVLPKVEAAPGGWDRPIWCMVETPAGILAAAAIAAAPGVEGLIVGTNDLNRSLRAREVAGRAPLAHALQAVLIAARAHDRVAIDGVYASLQDLAGFEAECVAGRDLGYDGKSLIHPDQIAVANRIFCPSAAEVTAALALIAAFEAAGGGVARIGGRMVEALHVAEAGAIIAAADAIAARKDAG